LQHQRGLGLRSWHGLYSDGRKGPTRVKISFVTNVTINVGGTFTISGIRVNANAFGTSGAINATAAAVVPASISGTNAITFSSGTTVQVANVNPKAVTTTAEVGPTAFLSCAAFVSADPDLELQVKENFAAALTSLADENGLSGAGTATQGSNLLVLFFRSSEGCVDNEQRNYSGRAPDRRAGRQHGCHADGGRGKR